MALAVRRANHRRTPDHVAIHAKDAGARSRFRHVAPKVETRRGRFERTSRRTWRQTKEDRQRTWPRPASLLCAVPQKHGGGRGEKRTARDFDCHIVWKIIATVAALLSTGIGCFGLDPAFQISQYQKRGWQVEDGLPRNYVFTIIPTSDDYLLVGTDEGMVRFDGLRFEPFDLDPALGLSKRWILATLRAADGSLWIGTFDGGLYRWRDGTVRNQWEGGASVFALAETSRGEVWASTRNGVVRWDGASFQRVGNLPGPPDNGWNVLTPDRQGGMWTVGADGLYRTNAQLESRRVADNGGKYGQFLSVRSERDGAVYAGTTRGVFRWIEPAGEPNLVACGDVDGAVVATLLDRQGNLWAGTWGQGLFRIQPNKGGGYKTERWWSRDGLSDDFVRTMFEDRQSGLWFGLRGGGLSRWRNPKLVPWGRPEGLSGDFASAVAQDRAGTLWLGTWRGGLYRVDQSRGNEGQFAPQRTPQPTPLFSVRALAFDRANRVWTGNWEGLWRLDQGRFTSFAGPGSGFQRVASIVFDKSGALWIGTSDNGIFRFRSGSPDRGTPDHLLGGREITALHEDGNGRLWAATTRGAGWLDASDQRLRYREVTVALNDTVTGLSEDGQGRMWGSTLSGKLLHFTSERAHVLDSQRGLPGYSLYQMVDDGRGSFWITTPRGILRIVESQIDRCLRDRSARLDPMLFDGEDGMRTVECHRLSQPAGARDTEGHLWFPTARGFIEINPDGLGGGLLPPRLAIESVSTGGKTARTGAPVVLKAGQSDLFIRYTAPYFFSSGKVRFRYKLEGFDKDWSPDDGTRTVRYRGLPPGDYRLLVAASLAGGNWGKPVTLGVEQQPYFFQTRWYAASMAALLCAVAALAVRWRVRRVKRRYSAVVEERNRIAREWHDTLLAGFSAISLQIDTALTQVDRRPERTRNLLELTRAMVHHYIAEARRVIWDLRDNRQEAESLVEAVSNALQQTTNGKSVEGRMAVKGEPVRASQDMEHNLLRICQEAFSNAVRYAEPSLLEVEIRYRENCVELAITDDGKGFDPESMATLHNGHFGLTMMRERAQRLGGKLQVDSRPGRGACVSASIPLQKPPKRERR